MESSYAREATPPAHPSPLGSAGGSCRLEDRQFALMRSAFEQTRGLCDANRLERLMRSHWGQPISVLARWLVDRRIVGFDHQGTTWIPMFQFEPESMHLEVSAARVIDELTRAFDDWELALWFACPNEALEGASPVSVIDADPDSVLAAARVDRFIALG